MEWKLLQDESQLKDLIKPIKKDCKGNFYTNYQFLNSTTDDDIKYTEIFFAQDGDNVYILKRKDDCYQFSYAAGRVEDLEVSKFPQSVQNSMVCCDIIEIEGKEKQGFAAEKLLQNGFKEYKSYHMWELDKQEIKVHNMKRFKFTDFTDEEYLKRIFYVFDPYADMLPLRKQFADYLTEVYSFSCLVKGEYAGSNIYKIKGNTGVEEFVFRDSKFPGVGAVLCEELLNRCFNVHNCNKVYAWIDDNNVPSIKMHEQIGFTRSRQYKKTYTNGETTNV